jgi:clan AA aspartic protease (TIGR02281 family)
VALVLRGQPGDQIVTPTFNTGQSELHHRATPARRRRHRPRASAGPRASATPWSIETIPPQKWGMPDALPGNIENDSDGHGRHGDRERSNISATAQTVCVAKSKNAFEVTLVLNRTVIVQGTLDSGATDLELMYDDAVRALQLNLGVAVDLQTAGGMRRAYSVSMTTVGIAAIELEKVETLVLEQTGPCRALIGLAVFRKFRSVTFNRDRVVLVGAKGPRREKKNCQ